MKILQIFGAVVAVHLLAFIFIFASPGCQSGPHNVPTPDATVPSDGTPSPSIYSSLSTSATPEAVDTSAAPSAYNYGPTPDATGHVTPTRPGSPAAVAITPARPTADVAPVSSYTVAKGDSLWSIAKKNNLTVTELAKVNSISTGAALKPGKKLIIPVKPGATVVREAAPNAPAPTVAAPKAVATPGNSSTVKHTVQSGESLGVIARRFSISVGELAAANNITDPSKVRAGQQLVIPAGKSGRPATTTPAATVTSPAAVRAASQTPAVKTTPAVQTPTAPVAAPYFEIKAPPAGQDLDAGLKETGPEVPTIKVEEVTAEPSPNN